MIYIPSISNPSTTASDQCIDHTQSHGPPPLHRPITTPSIRPLSRAKGQRVIGPSSKRDAVDDGPIHAPTATMWLSHHVICIDVEEGSDAVSDGLVWCNSVVQCPGELLS